MKILFLFNFSFLLTFVNSQILLAAIDIDRLIFDPSFYTESANIISADGNGAIIIPYQPGFADIVRLARRGNWVNIHMRINPLNFTTTSPLNIAEDIYDNLEVIGVSISGIWIDVINANEYWMISQKMNTALILNMLQTFQTFFSQKGFDLIGGVYTTKANWNIVTGGTNVIASAGFFYYSAYEDSLDCLTSYPYFAGWHYCYFKVLNLNTTLRNYSYTLLIYDYLILT